MKQGILTRLDAAPLLLKDAYLATGGCMILNDGLELPGLTNEINFERASSALATFRSLQVSNSHDLSIYLSLTISIVAFAEYVTGNEVFTLCQHAPNLVKPVFESKPYLEDHDLANISCLVFIETTEGFFRGKIPTFRFQQQHDQIIDRYLGLSLPLLPHLYDICELSYSLSQTAEPNTPSIMEALDRVEREVDQWRPTPPADFLERVSQTERIHCLAQAHVLSLTLLLVIHRFRFPFGINDDKAAVLSKCIMRELDSTRMVTQQVVKLAAFPFVVAAIEVVDSQEREMTIGKVGQVLGQSRRFHERLTGLILLLWHIRDTNKGVYWFNFSRYLQARYRATPTS